MPDPTPKEAFESLPDPTPKEAFESLKKLDTPASPKKRSELLVKKSAGNIEEDSFKKVSYASVVSTYFNFLILYMKFILLFSYKAIIFFFI